MRTRQINCIQANQLMMKPFVQNHSQIRTASKLPKEQKIFQSNQTAA
jgi:hypothetical protein